MTDFKDEELVSAIDRVIKDAGGYSRAAELSEIKYDTLRNWGTGRSEPKLFGFLTLLSALGLMDGALKWTGESNDISQAESGEVSFVPLYDVRLSAGSGSLNDRAEVLERIPLQNNQIRRLTGRTDITSLAFFRASGDSMLPTINDGDLVLVDQSDKRLRDGIFAFVAMGEARIKRFQLGMNEIRVVSDNDDLYSVEILPTDNEGAVQLIGKALMKIAPV